MARTISRTISCLGALLLLGACERPATDDSAEVPATPPVVASPTEPEPWFSEYVVRDLNGDGRADSAVLVARGERPDSSDVQLTLFVDGREAFTEQWSTAYELMAVRDSLRAPAVVESTLRDRMRKVLASLQLSPLEVDDLTVAQDPAAVQARLDSIVPLPTQQLDLIYGLESSVALIWDASRQRFVSIFICC